ncbi:MAG: hypothetical protein ACPL1A_10220 [Candidatus Kapaibacteriota bacterium]
MKNILLRYIKALRLLLLIVIINGIYPNFLVSENNCPSFQNCIISQSADYFCYTTPNSPSCKLEYKVCYGYIGDRPSINIEYFAYDQNCPCEDMMRHWMLKEIFENTNLLNFFGISEPNQEYFYDLYVANCASKVYFEGYYGTNGQFMYPGWKIINCGEQGCCQHIYKVVYRWDCNSAQGSLKLNWYNKESTNSYSENCIEPCFLNCYNWDVYSGPPMNKVNKIENFDVTLVQDNNNNINLFEYISKLDEEPHEIYIMNIYDINGQKLFEKIISKDTDFKNLFYYKNNQSKVYLYEVRLKSNKVLTGKILFKK